MLKKYGILLLCMTFLIRCEQFKSQISDLQIPSLMMYQYSTTIETEKPELDEVTKQLVSEYHKNPTQENYNKLLAQVEIDYEKVLDKKKAKLEELKETAKEQSKITEMEDIVMEMINDRENRINQTMLRLTDSRLYTGTNETEDEYVPVMGAGENIYISITPITNKEYLFFVKETGYTVPENWSDGNYPAGQEDYPVIFVSYQDAQAYCKWKTIQDSSAIYRLPSETEWELAAGHMPKDAAMNTDGTEGIVSVYAYSETTGASGAIDMWGNVWEWTSTERDSNNIMAVKGGAWNSSKTDCRTEYREEGRNLLFGYDNVGFRIIKEIIVTAEGKIPEKELGDISKESWQYAPAKYVYDKGIMTGKGFDSEGKVIFAPDEKLTREQFAQVLYSMEGKEEIIYTNQFSDVKEGQWYTSAIFWAAQKGIVSGYGSGKFGVGDSITREQLAAMLYKYAEYKQYDVNGKASFEKFSDENEISSWAVNQLQWAVSNEIISGKGEKLDPRGNATRAECAAMLMTFLTKFEAQ